MFFIKQIAWGKAIGMKMRDVINLDFEASRISLWTANLIYNTPLSSYSRPSF